MQKESITDLRIVRTIESIRNALIDLMRKKRFEAITVRDITTKAKINRGTFYAHYKDKYDLLKKCQEGIISDFSSYIKQGMTNFSNKSSTKDHAILSEMIAAKFEYIQQNAALFKVILDNDYDMSFQDKLKNHLFSTIIIKEQYAKKEKTPVPIEYLLSYNTGAHLSVIRSWLHNGRKETPQEMGQIILSIVMSGMLVGDQLKN
jgi:AcrR family transcriptional regulator